QPSGRSVPGRPVIGYRYTTVTPSSAAKSTDVPEVLGSATLGTWLPSRWDAAPSSSGTGRPAGSLVKSSSSLLVTNAAPQLLGPCSWRNQTTSPADTSPDCPVRVMPAPP